MRRDCTPIWLDTKPPTAPTLTSAAWATYWEHRGVALRWTESQDDNIVAGYRVLRDGAELDFGHWHLLPG